ncbi:response regulator [Myxococcota bacterium]|nr:response regulator [Myxococcota bacterium]MBU1413622.1 response regulator [Myxococcota bacterium]MBU1509220.1 response regulator [Myxococcota bacterium]
MLRIVVIDDDSLVLSMMRRSLRLFGFEVDCHSSAAAFFWHLDNGRMPDMVFSDVMMPQTNGLELYRRLKAMAGPDMPPFVFTTGYDQTGELENLLLENPEVRYLKKPFQLSQLRQLIHEQFGTRLQASPQHTFSQKSLVLEYE